MVWDDTWDDGGAIARTILGQPIEEPHSAVMPISLEESPLESTARGRLAVLLPTGRPALFGIAGGHSRRVKEKSVSKQFGHVVVC